MAKPKVKTKARNPPGPKKAWHAFLRAHPAPYTAAFAKAAPTPKGVTLTSLVRAALSPLASGAWETMTLKSNGSTVVWVAFADKADFEAVKAHFRGLPWKSNVIGAVDGFSYMLP